MAVISAIVACAITAWAFWRKTKQSEAECRAIRDEVNTAHDLYQWAQDAAIIVRDRTQHTDVMHTTIAALWGRHRDGQEFRHATMLFQTDAFKVYAQSKAE